ncbi:MAG: hypothetical protein ACRDHZ_08080 [Ktedonobacteraceae bacterium]
MEEYIYPVLPGTDYREHTEDRPFCGDEDCPCHEDDENMAQLNEWYQDGLIGSVDGDNIYRGRIV